MMPFGPFLFYNFKMEITTVGRHVETDSELADKSTNPGHGFGKRARLAYIP